MYASRAVHFRGFACARATRRPPGTPIHFSEVKIQGPQFADTISPDSSVNKFNVEKNI